MSEKRRRCPLSLRTTPEIRRALEIAAEASDRSLTQETEFRLEQSFKTDALRAIVREEVAAALDRRSVTSTSAVTIRIPSAKRQNDATVEYAKAFEATLKRDWLIP